VLRVHASNVFEMALGGFSVPAEKPDTQVLRAEIRVYSESIILTKHNEGGQAYATFEVSPEDLAAVFGGILIETPLLPKNTIFYRRANGREEAAVYLPPSQRKVRMDGGWSGKIPCPPLLFITAKTFMVFAVKQRPVDMGSRLFKAPYPNIYDDGHVCQGTADFPAPSLDGISGAIKEFFESYFNNDLGNQKSKRHNSRVTELWREIEGVSAYPMNDLIEAGLTLGEVLNGSSY